MMRCGEAEGAPPSLQDDSGWCFLSKETRANLLRTICLPLFSHNAASLVNFLHHECWTASEKTWQTSTVARIEAKATLETAKCGL